MIVMMMAFFYTFWLLNGYDLKPVIEANLVCASVSFIAALTGYLLFSDALILTADQMLVRDFIGYLWVSAEIAFPVTWIYQARKVLSEAE